MKKMLFALSGHLPCRLIKVEGQPYLERYYVGSLFGFTAFLHRFIAADGDREVHDHPWRIAMSIVLSGSYREEWVRHINLLDQAGWTAKMRHVRWFNWIPGHRFHRIADAEPETWTLFIHGKRTKGWGFLNHHDNVVTYHQPRDLTEAGDWHKTSSSGRDSDRVPMPR
ncbi:hypothetical protein FE236_11530 [Mariprofundus erugo]|uniref:Uncharacterized protein n=1 Tax=Mariprofundus erugo TaxID=2528639 RepID=A0A5R9GRC9_9PROT|nr:hypothetical protein [Mariprofundus erugo]TLS67499.1 hypothetical protein FEF65_06150 [Mariprofundus erugo]TLS74466.1 hypothetical protein FE236_11530 [Mariprofundus erugo]